MSNPIPSAVDIRAQLAALALDQLDLLAKLSGVPVSTLVKIRYAQTLNPGIETVRKFAPHLAAIQAATHHTTPTSAPEAAT